MKAPVVLIGRKSRSKKKAYRTVHLHRARALRLAANKAEAKAQAAADRRIARTARRIDAALRGCSDG